MREVSTAHTALVPQTAESRLLRRVRWQGPVLVLRGRLPPLVPLYVPRTAPRAGRSARRRELVLQGLPRCCREFSAMGGVFCPRFRSLPCPVLA